ncbi:MAG: PhoH family protein [Gemmatimonadota bacterium]|nr:PhoH family protein [Gemmatimonadota bacterium]MDH5803889.1 PhoH family protein [Gemmatimonadota bacterium]
MTETIQHRLSIEGADPLVLMGVNDGNLIALERATGVRATVRGDFVTLDGPTEGVERASKIVNVMIDTARMGQTLTPDDVDQLAANGNADLDQWVDGDEKIVLPGIRRPIVPKSPGQTNYLKAIKENDIVIGIGPAGTGKTYLAVAAGVEALVRKRVKKLILARPAVEAGERLGFLPGDLQAKIDPYLRPLYDALEAMMPPERAERAMEQRTIEIAPLAYMRGRTLSDAFVILDEAQNVTGGQMKMFLTRLGLNSQAVVIGDKTQIDLDQREESGLIQVERILPGIDGVAFCYMQEGDVVRHRLVREILKAYDEDRTS